MVFSVFIWDIRGVSIDRLLLTCEPLHNSSPPTSGTSEPAEVRALSERLRRIAMNLLNVVAWLLLAVCCARLSKRQRRLDAISLYDGLTGLLCGRVLERERWPAAIRASSPVGFVYVDLDDLKARNKSGGDRAGDEYIRSAAKRLERRRGVDQVFRLHSAGDEFGILVQGDCALRVGTFAELLVADLASAGISASVGAACTNSTDHKVRATVYEVAEAKMREAKETKGCARSTVLQ